MAHSCCCCCQCPCHRRPYYPYSPYPYYYPPSYQPYPTVWSQTSSTTAQQVIDLYNTSEGENACEVAQNDLAG